MKIARRIFNALIVVSMIVMIVGCVIGKGMLTMVSVMTTVIFLSISDKIKQRETANKIYKLANKEDVEIQLNESINPIWNEVRKHGNCYMRIEEKFAIIKVVIGGKEIEIPPIPLSDIDNYIKTD